MSTIFSPPPWRTEALENGKLVVMSGDDQDVCTLSVIRLKSASGVHVNRHEGNANLITVAPQLWLALKDAEEILRGISDMVPGLKGRVEAYRNLINKAIEVDE